MTQDADAEKNKAPDPSQRPKFYDLIDSLKSSKREELIGRLVSLLNTAFQKGLQTKNAPQVQQRWFTISGYLSQVLARVVRDMDYEKLRLDVEDLKKLVSNKNVNTPRRSRIRPDAGGNTTKSHG